MRLPTVLWAQRKDKLYLTIDLQDVKNQKIDLKDNKLVFEGLGGTDQQEYHVEVEFNKDVDEAASKVSVSARNVFCVIIKKDEGHWPRLTKAPQQSHIKCDWSKWVDEDEEDETPDKVDMNQFNFSGFGEGGMGGMGGLAGMGGMGGMGGMMNMANMMGGMGGMGGMGDMGDMGDEEGDEGEDSDDELPDLVK